MHATTLAARCAIAVAFLVLASAAPSLHAEPGCSIEDDGDCCHTNADCVAAVLASICVVVPLNRIAAAEVGEHDPATSLCTRERVEELRGEAAATPVRCVHEICEFPPVDAD